MQIKKLTVIELFAYFTASWGNKWTSGLEDKLAREIAFKIWQRVLDTLSDHQIKLGLDASVLLLDFPPSIAQFKKLALGLLSPNEAYQAAKNGNNDLRQLVAGGDWSWRTYPEDRLRSEFYQAYDAYMSQTLSEHIDISKELEDGDAETLQLQ